MANERERALQNRQTNRCVSSSNKGSVTRKDLRVLAKKEQVPDPSFRKRRQNEDDEVTHIRRKEPSP